MKKFLLFALTAVLTAGVFQAKAQLRDTVQQTAVQEGQTYDYFGKWVSGQTAPYPIDSLQVSDTIATVIPVNHIHDISFYLTWYWQKVGSGTATITASFYQGNDLYNFFPVQKGVLDSAYARTFTVSATGWNKVDFAMDSARFTARYLKVQFMTTNTASVGGKLFTRLKSFVK